MNQSQTVNKPATATTSRRSVRYLTRVGILSALAFLVMLFEFPLPFFADFLKIDFSDAIALVGGVALGPIAAISIELIKNLLNLVLHSTTGGIGEIANFLVGVALVLPITIVYRKFKTNLSLVLGMVLGALSMVIVASAANYFVLLPLWGVQGADRMPMILTMLVPFNLVKAVLESIAAFILFNGVKGIFKYIAVPNK